MHLFPSKAVSPSSLLSAARWLTALGFASLCTACPGGEPICGDGLVDVAEECDDGNGYAGDGCDAQCLVEEGYACAAQGDEPCTPTPVCGDGILTPNEWCDDGELNGPGYARCTLECTLGPYCGDGIVNTEFESCDNGINVGIGDNPCLPGCQRP